MIRLNLVVAVDKNGIMAKDGAIPWKCKEDLKWFKTLTTGHCLVLGRKTFESFGKPLPNRRHMVLSRMSEHADDNQVIYFRDMDSLLSACEEQKKYYVVGGREIYDHVLSKYANYVDKVYVSEIDADVECDGACLYFPFKHLCSEYFLRSRQKRDGFTLSVYERNSEKEIK